MELCISAIHIGERHRRDLGDLTALAESIKALGLLHPIVVSSDNVLVCGQRRLTACRDILGWETVPVRAVDIEDIILGERDENELRKDFTLEERVAIGEEVERRLGSRQGQRTDIGLVEDVPQVPQAPKGTKTREAAAKKAGFGNDLTYRQAKKVAKSGTGKLKAAVDAGEVSISAASSISDLPPDEQDVIVDAGPANVVEAAKTIRRQTKARKKKEKAAAKVAVPADLPKVGERYRLIHADIRDVRLEPESVDVVLCDPPYPKEYLDTFAWLAERSEEWLKPGGSLLVMSGQSWLPEVMERLTSAGLRYHWTLAYMTPGGQAVQLFDRRVNTFWKPVFWLVKGQYEGAWVGDVASSKVNDNDKRFHGWGQSESGMGDLLDRVSMPGQVVLDPFCGGGTTGVVAVRMNRLFIGIDCDEAAIATTAARLSDISDAEMVA
jgi:hypothetical protein